MNESIKLFCRYWCITICYMLVIFFVSDTSSIPMASFFSKFDKLIHGFEYTILAFLAFRSFYNFSIINKDIVSSFIAGAALAILYGMTDEFHQSFVPGRHYDNYDLLADALGAVFSILPVIIYLKIKKDHKSL